MKKVKIGFVGVGIMGQMAHLRNYVNIEDCEVTALAEMRPRTAELVADRYGIANVYNDHKAMLEAEELDGVVACQYFSTHKYILPELYPHVKYLFTEKPVAALPKTGQMLAQKARDAGCTHMVGYHKRYDPATIYAKEIIEQWRGSGELGKMKYIRLTMPFGDWVAHGLDGFLETGEARPDGPRETPDNMDEKEAEYYMPFVNGYCHQINLMRHLLGESYSVTYVDKSNVLLAIESESGISGVIEISPYQTTVEWQESALICFEKGYIRLDLPAPLAVNRAGRIEVFRDSGPEIMPEKTVPSLPFVHAMRQQAEAFVKVCKGQVEPLTDVTEAVEDLKNVYQWFQLRQKIVR